MIVYAYSSHVSSPSPSNSDNENEQDDEDGVSEIIHENEKETLANTDSEGEQNNQALRQKMRSKGLNCTIQTIPRTQAPGRLNSGGNKNTHPPRTNTSVQKYMPDGSIQCSSRDTISLIPVAPPAQSSKGQAKKKLRAK
jgi:hypothetical protein